jgi:hypothetical protein
MFLLIWLGQAGATEPTFFSLQDRDLTAVRVNTPPIWLGIVARHGTFRQNKVDSRKCSGVRRNDAVVAAVECGVEFRQAAAPRRSIERRAAGHREALHPEVVVLTLHD